jgi:hypothetical protein
MDSFSSLLNLTFAFLFARRDKMGVHWLLVFVAVVSCDGSVRALADESESQVVLPHGKMPRWRSEWRTITSVRVFRGTWLFGILSFCDALPLADKIVVKLASELRLNSLSR